MHNIAIYYLEYKSVSHIAKYFVDHNKLWKILKEMGIPDHWPASWGICLQVKKQQLELDMDQQTGSKLGKEYIKAVYCHPAYLYAEYIMGNAGLDEAQAGIRIQFSSVQSLSRVQLFATPWTAAHQASLSIINSWSLPKLMSIESVMPSNHLILCRLLLLAPSIFPNIRVFSDESTLCIR